MDETFVKKRVVVNFQLIARAPARPKPAPTSDTTRMRRRRGLARALGARPVWNSPLPKREPRRAPGSQTTEDVGTACSTWNIQPWGWSECVSSTTSNLGWATPTNDLPGFNEEAERIELW